MKFGTAIVIVLLAVIGIMAAYFFGVAAGKRSCRANVLPLVEYRDTCSTVVLQDSTVAKPVVITGDVKRVRTTPKRVVIIPLDTTTTLTDSILPYTLDETPKTPKLYEYSDSSYLLQVKEYVVVVGDIVAFERTIKLDTLMLEKRFTNTIVTTVTQPVIVKDYPTRIGIMGTVDTKAAFGVGAYSIFPQGQTVGVSYNVTNKALMLNAGVPIFNIKKRK